MPPKRLKKSKTKKGHHKKSPKRSPQRRTNDVVNDNPVSPSLGVANAFNLLLQKYSSPVEVLIFLCFGSSNLILILSSYSHILSS